MKTKRCIEGLLSFLILTSSVINVKAESNVNSWSFTNGAWYHFDEQGNAQTGLQEIDRNLYYLDGNGVMKTGWQYIGNEWYYFHANGMAARNGWVGNYYLGSDGKMLRNQWVGGYYVDGNGAWVPSASEWCWIKENNIWKYHSTRTGQNLSNAWSYINGAWYHFDAQGNMQTGLQEVDGNLYYLGGNGAMKTGWQYAGEWYYFHANGMAARNGWMGNYYLGSDGKMLRNQWVGDYYVDGNGAWVPNASSWQWIKENNKWKYVNTRTGSFVKSKWMKTGSFWHYFDKDGYSVTGWQKIDGDDYCFDNNGAMFANEWVGDYYLNANGKMARNQWIGDYHVGADGKLG